MNITMDSARRTSMPSDGAKTERAPLLADANVDCDIPLVYRTVGPHTDCR